MQQRSPEAKSGTEESPLPEQHDAVARDPEVKNLVWAWLADKSPAVLNARYKL